MTLINKEFFKSKKYEIKYNMGKPRICRKNVYKIDAILRTDSSYRKASDSRFAPIFSKKGKLKYGGSSSYWGEKLKESLAGEKVTIPIEATKYAKSKKIGLSLFSAIIFFFVCAIDRENSTHLNSDLVGRKEISDRIIFIGKTNIKDELCDDDYPLIGIISAATSKGRHNPSFASKFCHYACFYLFNGKPEQDRYSIFDSVMVKGLKEYGITEIKIPINGNLYKQYLKIIDKIRGSKISRNGFDHLIWYCFKGS